MKKNDIKNIYKLTPKQYKHILVNGQYCCSKLNMSFPILVICLIGFYTNNAGRKIGLIMAIIGLIMITMNFLSIKLRTKRLTSNTKYSLNIEVTLSDKSIIYKNSYGSINERIDYKNIAYIMKTKEYLILVVEQIGGELSIVPLKKDLIKISEEELSQNLLKKCYGLEKNSITSPVIMHFLHICCFIIYCLFIIIYFI